jgi:hypothetical protein
MTPWDVFSWSVAAVAVGAAIFTLALCVRIAVFFWTDK